MAWRGNNVDHNSAAFTIRWKISKDEFDNISNQSIVKKFSTSYKHAVCDWKAEFRAGTAANKVTFVLSNSGPLKKIKFGISLVMLQKNNDRYYKSWANLENICNELEIHKEFIIRDLERIDSIPDISSDQYRINLTIPISLCTFSCVDIFGAPVKCQPEWVIALHSKIGNPESKRSDIQLVSGDGQTFYCHQIVFDSQMVFDAMFRHATTDEEKRGIFRFPSMKADNLRKALEYMYLGTTNLDTTAVPDLIQLIDFAEQYGLKVLKGIAAQRLWDIAVEIPSQCIDIARIADLHADTGLVYLRNRCFDVMAENYDKLGLNVEDLGHDPEEPPKKKKRVSEKEKENQGSKLRQEFVLYLCRRVTPMLQMAKGC